MHTRRVFHCAALAVLLSVLTSASSAIAGQQHKLDRALQLGKSSQPSQRVIVQVRPGQADWVRAVLAESGRLAGELSSVGSLTTELSAGELEALCESSEAVAMCHSDADVRSDGLPGSAPPGQAMSTLLSALGLRADSRLGSGVTVAVIDSGLHPSSAFAGRVKAFRDFTGTSQSGLPFDDFGHGTHVAGLIGGGQRAADVAFQGVAPGVSFVILKVLDSTGTGKTSDVIRAIEYAVANQRSPRHRRDQLVARASSVRARPRPIRWFKRSNRLRPPDSSSSHRPATTAWTPTVNRATAASAFPATRPRC